MKDKIFTVLVIGIIMLGYCLTEKWLEKEREINQSDKIQSILIYDKK